MATIVMASHRVILAANKVIKMIEDRRAAEDEKTIQNIAEFEPRFSFRRGFYRMTHEEAKVWLKENGGFSGNWSYSYYAWGDLAKAKDLLHLAQYGDPITLNEDDVRILF